MLEYFVPHDHFSPLLPQFGKGMEMKTYNTIVQNHIKVAAKPLEMQSHYITNSKHNIKLQGTNTYHQPNDLNFGNMYHIIRPQDYKQMNTNPIVLATIDYGDTTRTLLQQKPYHFHQQVHICWTQYLSHISQHSACNWNSTTHEEYKLNLFHNLG